MLATQKSRPLQPMPFEQEQQQRQKTSQRYQPLNHLTVSSSSSNRMLSKQQLQHQRLSLAPTAYSSHAGTFVGAHTISRANNLANEFLAASNQQIYHFNGALDQVSSLSATLQHKQQPLIRSLKQAQRSNHLSEHSTHLRLLAQAHQSQQQQLQNHHKRNLMILHQQQQQQQYYEAASTYMTLPRGPTSGVSRRRRSQQPISRPLCRCRVMYLGSSVPHVSKNGLHGIQEPLRHLYPEEQFTGKRCSAGEAATGEQTIDISHLSAGLGGIDSWLSVWSNGILLENFDELGREVKRFFAIESLHYCAAVRFFDTANLQPRQSQEVSRKQPEAGTYLQEEQSRPQDSLSSSPPTDQNNNDIHETAQSGTLLQSRRARFLPLDAPIFGYPAMLDASHPPVFAAIVRRTTGIKVLECHAFICRRDAAANALVRCCTHAYADHLNARRVSIDLGASSRTKLLAEATNTRHQQGTTDRGPIYEALASSRYTGEKRQVRESMEQNAALSSSKIRQVKAEETQQVDKQESTANYALVSRSKENEPIQGKNPKGSSRSLYTDFQVSSSSSPDLQVSKEQVESLMSSPKRAGETQRLSQSLELLERTSSSITCCQQLRADQFTQRSRRHSKGERKKVAQSREGSRRKERHSRSMQDLENEAAHYPGMMISSQAPPSLSAAESRSRRRARDRSRSRRRSSRLDNCCSSSSLSARQSASRKRRSASIHEISQHNGDTPIPPKQQQQQMNDAPSSSRTSFMDDESLISQVENVKRAKSVPKRQQRHLTLVNGRAHPTTSAGIGYLPSGASIGVGAPFYLPPAALPYHQQLPYHPSNPYLRIQQTGLLSGPYQHPLVHPQHLAAAAAAAHHQQQQAMLLGHSPPYFVGPPASGSTGKSAGKRMTRKCQTLARFRCLSPPAAFGLKPAGHKQPLVQRTEDTRSPAHSEELKAAGSEIVSAEPGFMARRSRDSSSSGPRVSWIKRLSLLSVTSGLKSVGQNPAGESEIDCSVGLTNGAEMREEDEAGKASSVTTSIKEPKKRRSRSLFAGSLTLGRRRQRAIPDPVSGSAEGCAGPANNTVIE